MNNNLGMQPNDFNNQNGAMQNQANNMQMNNQPMNNQPMNNQPMNNVPVNNVAVNNVQPNNVQTGGYQEQSTQMNQQYNQGYSNQNMNVMNNNIGSQMLNTTATVVKHSSKTLILGGIFGVAVIAVSIVCVVLFLGKDKGSKQQSGGETVSTPDSGLNSIYDLELSENETFFMPIDHFFTMEGRGTVITGRVASGNVKIGDKIEIVGLNDEIISTKVVGFANVNEITSATVGDNPGIVLENVTLEQLERGKVAIKPNSITPKKEFHAYIEMLPVEKGERDIPIKIDDSVIVYINCAEVEGIFVSFENGFNEINSGDQVDVTIKLNLPVALKSGIRFSIYENGKTIANGVVTEVLE